MMFYLWHTLAIVSLMLGSGFVGYRVGSKKTDSIYKKQPF
jgi:hypothetical protein